MWSVSLERTRPGTILAKISLSAGPPTHILHSSARHSGIYQIKKVDSPLKQLARPPIMNIRFSLLSSPVVCLNLTSRGAAAVFLFLMAGLAGTLNGAEQDLQADLAAASSMREAALEMELKPLNKILEQYKLALQRLKGAAQAEGDLDGVVAADKALSNLLTGAAFSPLSGAAFSPLSENPKIAGIQQAHQKAHDELKKQVEVRSVAVARDYSNQLENMVKELTRTGKTEDALKVRKIREKFIDDYKAARATNATTPAKIQVKNAKGSGYGLATFPKKAAWIQRATSVDSGHLLQISDGVILTNSHYSEDGVKWNAVKYPSYSNWLNCSGYGANTFVLTGAGGQIFTSRNFKNWIDHSPGGEDITSVIYGNNTFIARKYWSPGGCWVSKNKGNSWTSVDTGGAPDKTYCGMSYGNGIFVYPLDNSVRTSVDGIIWANHAISSLPSGFEMRSASHFNGKLFIGSSEVARSETNVKIITASSPDGINWEFKESSIISSSAGKFRSVGAGGGFLMLLSPATKAEVWISDNQGDTWTNVDGPWSDVEKAEALFVVKGKQIVLATGREIYSSTIP